MSLPDTIKSSPCRSCVNVYEDKNTGLCDNCSHINIYQAYINPSFDSNYSFYDNNNGDFFYHTIFKPEPPSHPSTWVTIPVTHK